MECLKNMPPDVQPPERIISCKACEVFINKHSRVGTNEETDESEWKCEFCYNVNTLPPTFTINDVPKTEEVTYCLTPPEEKKVEEEAKGEAMAIDP